MVLGMKPLRWALQFSPPTIVLEYQSAMGNQMYHYRIDMGERISSSMREHVIVRELQEEHKDYIGTHIVTSEQLTKLVRKLKKHVQESNVDTSLIDRLPTADYNKASEAQLKIAKSRMDVVFQEKAIRPGDEGFVYDKQVEFGEATEDCDWDN